MDEPKLVFPNSKEIEVDLDHLDALIDFYKSEYTGTGFPARIPKIT